MYRAAQPKKYSHGVEVYPVAAVRHYRRL